MTSTHVFEGIAAISQLLIAFGTGAVAWVAYVVFVEGAKSKHEEHEREEIREIVAGIIASTETYIAKVNQANAVSIKKVSFFSNELAAYEASVGIARAHGFSDLVDAANEYIKSVKAWRRSIIRAKKKRPDEKEIEETGLPDIYREAREKASAHYTKVEVARALFFKEASGLLRISISVSASEDFDEDVESDTEIERSKDA